MSGGSSLVKVLSQIFLIWECIESTLVFSVFRFSPFNEPTRNSKFDSLMFFIIFQTILYFIMRALSFMANSVFLSLFAVSLYLSFLPILLYLALTLPPLDPIPHVASPFDSVSRAGKPLPRHVRIFISYIVFIAVAGVTASVSLVILCGRRRVIDGLAVGVFYALDYLYRRRWILHFPIIQHSPFFNFKMCIPDAAMRALQLSVVASVFSAVLSLSFLNESEAHATYGQFIVKQITFFAGIFMVFLCWELNHHLHQVLNTKRVVFAPPEDSTAAKRNPSESLLAALEESTPKSLTHYLAYFDLYMVCESDVDTSRLAAFFEETGETYKRAMTACLKPLEKLTWELLCAWCARIAALLTVRLQKEDRCECFRLPSYASVLSTLLSCLLAVEAVMGEKTNFQSPQLTDQANIKWDTRISSGLIVKSNSVYSKAYSMANILRTAIYCIVSAFHNEMTSSDKTKLLDAVWVTNNPLFGTRKILLQKLRLFMEL